MKILKSLKSIFKDSRIGMRKLYLNMVSKCLNLWKDDEILSLLMMTYGRLDKKMSKHSGIKRSLEYES